ncbi:MAG: tRNA lysidine(34) synthetase TilS [Sedimentisphaerales bacterium]|nr:tRNA lysidine(34) synthetase TilS [Sedimentisphaerales bacterium]
MDFEFENQILGFIGSEGLFDGAERVLAAVSGGADSAALLQTLIRLKQAGQIEVELSVGNVNHNLRGAESDGDSEFVAELGEKLGIEVLQCGVETKTYAKENKVSIETAARELRIEALCKMARKAGAEKIVMAHHMDDNAETIIHRLVRGTGFRGLGGIWPRRRLAGLVEVVRPLLCVSRKQIEEYCGANGFKWRTDKTNDEVVFTRNRIRHLVLPELQKDCKEDLSKILFELSSKAQKLYRMIEAEAQKAIDEIKIDDGVEKIVLNKQGLARLDRLVAVEVVRRVLVLVGSGERDLKQEHYERVLELTGSGESGKVIELPDGFAASVEYEKISFYRNAGKTAASAFDKVCLNVPGLTETGGYKIETRVFEAGGTDIERFKKEKEDIVEWFDADKLHGKIAARSRKEGDRFFPLGGEGEKKVGKFLTAAKVEGDLRDKVFVIEDDEKIIWLAPVRASELTKVDSKTKRILEISLL